MEGRSARTKIPSSRFNVDAFYHPDSGRPGSVIADAGYFLTEDQDPRLFDANFFGISLAEAISLDPMQRKLLEVGLHFCRLLLAVKKSNIPIYGDLDKGTIL